MLHKFHLALHRLLNTRTKQALAVTLLYAFVWLGIYDVAPPANSLAAILAGSREAAQHAANVLMEALFWVTLGVIVLIAVVPSRLRLPGRRV